MNKNFKRILSLCIAVMMLCSVMFSSVLTVNATEYKVGDLVEFGSYPQTEVKDEATLNALNSKSLNWISYGYYSGNGETGSMVQSDYMKYADVTYNGTKYRAVKFTEYRPQLTTDVSPYSNSEQNYNGYTTNTTYWFKYEPLKWRVLDPNEGLIMCETIIDSQAYSNAMYYNDNEYWNDSSYTNYANDYETSSIREWLNDDFYNLAFTSDQKSDIKTTTHDNSAYSSEFDSATTNDKVFLLSWGEVHNTSYGFDSGSDFNAVDTAREAKGSDYAKCQGIHDFSYWWLRSPGSNSDDACYVYDCGYVYIYKYVHSSFVGVRPALKITNLSFLAPASANNGTVGYVAIAAVLGIALGVAITVIIMKKKISSASGKSNSTKATDTDFSEIVSFATLTDEQLEHLNQKLNEQNTKTKFKNFKLK